MHVCTGVCVSMLMDLYAYVLTCACLYVHLMPVCAVGWFVHVHAHTRMYSRMSLCSFECDFNLPDPSAQSWDASDEQRIR